MFSLTRSFRLVNSIKPVLEVLEGRRLLSADVAESDLVDCVQEPYLFAVDEEYVEASDETADKAADEEWTCDEGAEESEITDDSDVVIEKTDVTDDTVTDDTVSEDGVILYKDYYIRTLSGGSLGSDGEVSSEEEPLETTGTTDGTDVLEDNPEVIYYSMGGAVQPTASLADGVLTITGTEGNDNIRVAKSRGAGDKLVVSLNGQKQRFAFAQVTSILADLKGGNDTFKANEGNGELAIPMKIKGGAGNDRITGGSDDDHLAGGIGKDKLNGAEGDDVLAGNGGHDSLRGGAGDDVLNGGTGEDKLRGDGGTDTNEDPVNKLLDRKNSDNGHRRARNHTFSLTRLSDGSRLSQMPIWIGEEYPTDTPGDVKPTDPNDVTDTGEDTSGDVLDESADEVADVAVK